MFIFMLLSLISISYSEDKLPTHAVDCNTLGMGQYLCPDPDPGYIAQLIDPKTQELRGCTKDNKAKGR